MAIRYENIRSAGIWDVVVVEAPKVRKRGHRAAQARATMSEVEQQRSAHTRSTSGADWSAERDAAEARRANKRLDTSAPHLPAVASSGWFGPGRHDLLRNTPRLTTAM